MDEQQQQRQQHQSEPQGTGKLNIYHKPDSGQAWIILAACAAIFFLILGSFRCYGIIFISIMGTFNVTREEASWPLVLAGSLMNSSGLLSGFMSLYFSPRFIITLGCLISSSAVLSCYFARSVSFITFIFGIFHGLGNGLVVAQIPSIISQYFVRLRGTANGLALAGSTLGSLALPFLIEIFFLHNSLHMGFLYMGLLLMPTIIFSSILVSPALSQSQKPESPAASTQNDPHVVATNSDPQENEEEAIIPHENTSNSLLSPESGKFFQSYLRMLKNPYFALVCFTHTVFIWSWSTFFVVIVDFAMDLGNERQKSIWLMSIFSITDLIGRVFSGLLSDKNILSRSTLAGIFSLIIGLVYVTFSQITSYISLAILCMVLGLAVGGLILLFSVLFIDYIGLDQLSQAMGTSYFICGLTTLSRPWIIGYFRDHLKSYRGLFITLGILDMIAALLWLINFLGRRCLSTRNPRTT
ncbi:monocarboxylate transporter 12-like [Brevipalpus obovatus]|uniref:monocarboxylate transporter 12-like n=1 Tax=Brevipalpus obovatus TaxID=246614 RepID=UPI003D9E60D4